jgi:hypothetical protein
MYASLGFDSAETSETIPTRWRLARIDVDRSNGGPKFVVNAVEATQVREIFDRYIECGSRRSTQRRAKM